MKYFLHCFPKKEGDLVDAEEGVEEGDDDDDDNAVE